VDGEPGRRGGGAFATNQFAVPVTLMPNFSFTSSGAACRTFSSTARAACAAGFHRLTNPSGDLFGPASRAAQRLDVEFDYPSIRELAKASADALTQMQAKYTEHYGEQPDNEDDDAQWTGRLCDQPRRTS
jgi:hypothetical protein